MANNNLKVSSLVLNEVEELQKVIKSKELPQFWSVYQFLYRFTKYYRGLDYNDAEIVGMAVEWLIDSKTDYEVDAVCDLIASVPKEGDENYHPLRELPTTIIFYESELETIKTIKNRTTQQFYFTMLVICKTQEIKGSKNPSYIYSDLNDIARLAKLNISNTNKFLIELGFEMKLLKAPLDANYIEVMTSSEGKKKRIKEFNPTKIQEYFIKLFGKFEPEKPVIALDYYGDEKPQYFNSISECARALNVKQSDISRCTQRVWKKNGTLTANDYIFIDATRKEEESDKEYNIRMATHKIFLYGIKRYYSKLKSGKVRIEVPTDSDCKIIEIE